MSLDDTATSSDLEPEGHVVDPLLDTFELRPTPVPADYGGILDPQVRGDASGNVQTLEPAPADTPLEGSDEWGEDKPQTTEDPYWKGYSEGLRETNLRERALTIASAYQTADIDAVMVRAQRYLDFLRTPAETV